MLFRSEDIVVESEPAAEEPVEPAAETAVEVAPVEEALAEEDKAE